MKPRPRHKGQSPRSKAHDGQVDNVETLSGVQSVNGASQGWCSVMSLFCLFAEHSLATAMACRACLQRKKKLTVSEAMFGSMRPYLCFVEVWYFRHAPRGKANVNGPQVSGNSWNSVSRLISCGGEEEERCAVIVVCY